MIRLAWVKTHLKISQEVFELCLATARHKVSSTSVQDGADQPDSNHVFRIVQVVDIVNWIKAKSQH